MLMDSNSFFRMDQASGVHPGWNIMPSDQGGRFNRAGFQINPRVACKRIARIAATCALVGWFKRVEGLDVYDTNTNFTPFKTRV